jgi:hypothetical protein
LSTHLGRLPSGEYTGKSRLPGGEFNGMSIRNANTSSIFEKILKSFLGMSTGTRRCLMKKYKIYKQNIS